MAAHLTNYSTSIQQYGDFFASFPWSHIDTGTFRKRVGLERATKWLKQFMRDLGMSVRARIAYVAVPERRTSGLGLAPIPLHFHFVIACPSQHVRIVLANARGLWSPSIGDIKIGPYDPSRAEGHYLAKLAE